MSVKLRCYRLGVGHGRLVEPFRTGSVLPERNFSPRFHYPRGGGTARTIGPLPHENLVKVWAAETMGCFRKGTSTKTAWQGDEKVTDETEAGGGASIRISAEVVTRMMRRYNGRGRYPEKRRHAT